MSLGENHFGTPGKDLRVWKLKFSILYKKKKKQMTYIIVYIMHDVHCFTRLDHKIIFLRFFKSIILIRDNV